MTGASLKMILNWAVVTVVLWFLKALCLGVMEDHGQHHATFLAASSLVLFQVMKTICLLVNPHPLHGAVLHVNPRIPPHWVHEQAGAAEGLLAELGVQPQQMQQAFGDLALAEYANDGEAEN
jgi:hypothetical protein